MWCSCVMRVLCALIVISLLGCTQSNRRGVSGNTAFPALSALHFDGDSAYRHVDILVGFGARVPGTSAHGRALEYIVGYMRALGVRVIVDTFVAERFDGERLQGYNIIGVVNPSVPLRVLLASHWDTRPWADQDTGILRRTPPAGADDGASSTGVLLELARVLSQYYPYVGVDVVFFDLEDQGPPRWLREASAAENLNWWCLGSQHWSRNPHRVPSAFVEGLLLDMVGSSEAVFPMEAFSLRWARETTLEVWAVAEGLGFAHRFPAIEAPPVTDDHYFVNTIAGIPTAAIIGRNLQTPSGFPAHWHTHGDSLPVIDRETLQMVGQVVEAWLITKGWL